MKKLDRENFSTKPDMWTPLKFDANKEGNLYSFLGDLYKFYEMSSGVKKLILRNKAFFEDSENAKDCVAIKKVVYINNDFVGIKMKYYQEYLEISKVLENSLPFAEREYMAKEILRILESLEDEGYFMIDCHINNFIYNGKKLLLCDHLGGTTNPLIQAKYLEKYLIRKVLTILSILYNCDFYAVGDFVKNGGKELTTLLVKISRNITLKRYWHSPSFKLSKANFKQWQFPENKATEIRRKLVLENLPKHS